MDHRVCRGEGQAAATRAFAALEEGGPIDLVFSIGWAGALTRDLLAPGSAHNVAGVIDTRTGERFRCDAGAGDLWLATSPRVANEAEKLRLAATYNAALVDMEAVQAHRPPRLAARNPLLRHQGRPATASTTNSPTLTPSSPRRGSSKPPVSPYLPHSAQSIGPGSSKWAKIVGRLPKTSRNRFLPFSRE